MRPSRVLPFPTVVSPDSEHFRPLDGVYRDCVIRLREPDLLGRNVYVALDRYGFELDRGSAVSWENTVKLATRLLEVVEAARNRGPRLVD